MFQTVSLVFLAFVGLVAAQSRHGLQPPADPFADPKHDVFNPLRYIASDALSGMGVALTLALALGQTFWSIKYRTKFMLAMVIAAYTYALGIAIRFGLSRHPDSSGLYIVEYLFVTLSPCGFIAAEYVLLGRLSRSLGGDKHMLISPQRITLVFVISDISTFLVQAAGGGISASAHEDLNKAKAGSNVFLVGLALQLASFCFFMILYLRFIIRMYKYEKETWVRDAHLPWYKDWRALAGAFTVSCIGVLVRSVYRTVELSEGFGGYLSRTEVFFYVLDFVPLIIALLAYIPFWPGRFITNSAARGISPDSSVESTDPEKGDKVQETVRAHSAEGAETLSGNLEGEKEH